VVLELSYQFPGDEAKQFSVALLRWGDKIKSPFAGVGRVKSVGPAVFSWFEKIEVQQFATKGARGGKPWAPLAASTIKRKGPGAEMMVETGQMKGALTQRRHPAAMRIESGIELKVGIAFDSLDAKNPLYPIYHQSGSPKTNLPRRRVTDFSKKDGIKLAKIVQKHIVDVATEIGLR